MQNILEQYLGVPSRVSIKNESLGFICLAVVVQGEKAGMVLG